MSVEGSQNYFDRVYSRRGLLRVVGGAAAVGLLNSTGRVVQAQAPGIERANLPLKLVEIEKKQNSPDWSKVHKLLEEISGKDPKNIHWEGLKEGFKGIEKAQKPYTDHLGQIIELFEAREKSPQHPSLRELYKKRLAKIDPEVVNVDEIIPFLAVNKFINGTYEDTVKSLEEIKNGLDKLGTNPKTTKAKEKLIGLLISQAMMFPPPEEGEANRGECTNQVDILAYNASKLTPEGKAEFEKDARKIKLFISRYSFFGKLCTEIVLHSKRYGGKAAEEKLGSFTSGRDFTRKNNPTIGIAHIYMDEDHPGFEGLPEFIFAHEALGHGLSVENNASFIHILSPEDYLYLLTHRMQVLLNPDWGNIPVTVSELFTGGEMLNIEEFLKRKPQVTPEEYEKLCLQYPTNVIANNIYGQNLHEKTACDTSRILFWNSDGEEAPVQLGIESLFRLKEANNPTAQTPGNEPRYLSLKDFASRNKAELIELSKKSREFGVLLWGLNNFIDAFERSSRIWDMSKDNETRNIPKPNDPEPVWINYLKLIHFSTLYHAVFNDSKDIRNLYDVEEWKQLTQKMYRTRFRAEEELWAELCGFSFIFGDRMSEVPPARRAMERIAYSLAYRT